MNAALEEIYKSNVVYDGEGNAVNPFPTATPKEVGTLLHNFILQNDLERTLEIGMAYGLSTLFICQAHENRQRGSHIAVDPGENGQWKGIGLLNVERANLKHRLRFMEMPSFVALPQLLAEGVQLDFAFIDGSHLFDYAFVDYFYVDRLIRVGGFVAFDDLWMPAVRKVISFMLTNRDYEAVPLNTGIPIGRRIAQSVLRISQNPLERDPASVRWMAGNICVLQKKSENRRKWTFHRPF